ncbi:hypothetical protein MBLNU230_g1481t1 [Neophaeotheca triangularis]
MNQTNAHTAMGGKYNDTLTSRETNKRLSRPDLAAPSQPAPVAPAATDHHRRSSPSELFTGIHQQKRASGQQEQPMQGTAVQARQSMDEQTAKVRGGDGVLGSAWKKFVNS